MIKNQVQLSQINRNLKPQVEMRLTQNLNDPQRILKLFKKYGPTSNISHNSKIFTTSLPGYGKVQIHRAGVILITRQNKQMDKLVVILGTDKNCGSAKKLGLTQIENWMEEKRRAKIWLGSCWFSGSCDQEDKNFTDTVIRETFEESAGVVGLTEMDVADAIDKGRFLYNPKGHILTVILVTDSFPDAPQEFERSHQKLVQLKNSGKEEIPDGMLEMVEYHTVELNEFLGLVDRMMDFESLESVDRYDGRFHLKTTRNKIIRLDHFYAQCLGVGGATEAFRLALKGVAPQID